MKNFPWYFFTDFCSLPQWCEVLEHASEANKKQNIFKVCQHSFSNQCHILHAPIGIILSFLPYLCNKGRKTTYRFLYRKSEYDRVAVQTDVAKFSFAVHPAVERPFDPRLPE